MLYELECALLKANDDDGAATVLLRLEEIAEELDPVSTTMTALQAARDMQARGSLSRKRTRT
jgi:hypothetical protein